MSAAAEFAEPLVVVEPESRWEWVARWFGPLVIFVCALTAYANSFTTPFIFDGVNYLRDNPEIRILRDWDHLQLEDVKKVLSHVKSRPLGYLTFALNYALAKDEEPRNQVFTWHLTNFLIHFAAACAVFGIARRTFASRRLVDRYGPAASRLALAIAVLWAVHPLNTQSVTYIYQRLESLMGMFYLFTLYAFIRYTESRRIGWSVVWSVASLLSCLAACATKEVAVTAPFMVLLYDVVFVAESGGELVKRRGVFHGLLWMTLLLPLCLIMISLNDYPNAGILDTTRVTPGAYARTQAGVVLHYLRLAVVPWGLNIDYAWPIAKFEWREYGLPMVGISLVLFLAAYTLVKNPPMGFLGAWWFVILAPTSSIAPIIDQAFEHRTYLSLIGIVALEVIAGYEGIGWLVRRRGGDAETASVCRVSACLLLISIYTSLTLIRNHDYRSELAMWRDVRFKVPGNPRGHYNYGVYLQIANSEGVADSKDYIEEAIVEYKETLRLDPNYADAFLNLGSLANWKAQVAEGNAEFAESQSDSARAERYHAEAKQERAIAEDNLRNFLRFRPGDVPSMVGLAEALIKLNRPDEARPLIEQALQSAPNDAGAKRLQEELNKTTPEAPAPPPGSESNRDPAADVLLPELEKTL